MAPALAPACCCSIFPELGASTATRAASLAHRAGIYSNVERQMLKLSNISTIQSSLAKVFAKNASHPNTTAPQSLFMLRQTARPRPLTAVAVVVAHDIMLLLI